MMDLNDYQKGTRRTSPELGVDKLPYLINYSMGAAGESGELLDHIKKVAFQGHDLDKEDMAFELGDILYYVARFADTIGYDLEEIAKMNQDKLLKRYPNGFNKEDSLKRVDTNESN